MGPIDQQVEQQIARALERGDFEDLPGAGKPLQLEDLSHLPPELRTAYLLLKGGDFLPPEVTLRREIRDVEGLLCQSCSDSERRRAATRLSLLNTRLEACGGSPLRTRRYRVQLLNALD